jgi:hypothetical protein
MGIGLAILSGLDRTAAMIRPVGARLALLVLALCACLTASTATASATVNPLAIAPPGGGSLGLGLTDDPLFVESSPGDQDVWLTRARALGSSWIRIDVLWRAVAPYSEPQHFHAEDPSDRAYNWSQIDGAVRAAVAHGQTPLVNVHSAPLWAEGRGRPSWAAVGSWEPSAAALEAFAHALAVRYSGHFPDSGIPGHHLPRVRYFQAWNEPNLLPYLSPQWVQDSRGAIFAASPALYRSLLNGFYAGIKGVQPSAQVFAAGTAPFGDPPGQGLERMGPVTFLEGVFCLNSALRRTACPGGAAHLDGLDHHVYSPPWYGAAFSTDVGVPDLGRIRRILGKAQDAHTVLPRGPKALWITEIGASATPPTGPSFALQAHDLEEDLYEFWSEHVANVFWFTIRDSGLAAGSFFAYDGLFTQSDTPKPAAAAYRFPFVALPHGQGKLTLWGRAPRAGQVLIERLAGSRWRPFVRLRTSRGAIFYAHVRARGKPMLRARIGGATSPPWIAGF